MKKHFAFIVLLTGALMGIGAHADNAAPAPAPAPEKAPAAAPSTDASRARAKVRFALERKTYTPEQLKEIEALYQVVSKQAKSPEAQQNLKILLEKYPKANRTGCALQYIGQVSVGLEKEAYLTQAIKDFSDCYYGDGVQVGAYARFYLAAYYAKAGKKDEAKALYDQIRKDYPDAVNHKGKLLVEMIPQ